MYDIFMDVFSFSKQPCTKSKKKPKEIEIKETNSKINNEPNINQELPLSLNPSDRY